MQGGAESEGPSESECRPYIEKALKELETAEAASSEPISPGDGGGDDSQEEYPTVEITTDDSEHAQEADGDNEDEADEENKDSSAESVDALYQDDEGASSNEV